MLLNTDELGWKKNREKNLDTEIYKRIDAAGVLLDPKHSDNGARMRPCPGMKAWKESFQFLMPPWINRIR